MSVAGTKSSRIWETERSDNAVEAETAILRVIYWQHRWTLHCALGFCPNWDKI
jgi:hypothetical protein